MERGLLDLILEWVDQVRSAKLARVLDGILAKLSLEMEQSIKRILSRGPRLASQISRLAFSWGNAEAFAWRFDKKFQEALALGVIVIAI